MPETIVRTGCGTGEVTLEMVLRGVAVEREMCLFRSESAEGGLDGTSRTGVDAVPCGGGGVGAGVGANVMEEVATPVGGGGGGGIRGETGAFPPPPTPALPNSWCNSATLICNELDAYARSIPGTYPPIPAPPADDAND